LAYEFDVLVRDATVVDGSGKKAFTGSIGIRRGKVVEVGKVKGDTVKEIDAKGLTAVPGFIDAHSHHDGTILWYPGCESYVMQGVTTFVGCQCGSSPAPIGDKVHLFGRLLEYSQDYIPHKYYPEKNSSQGDRSTSG
jgi:N-acyl-D-aspartate/D-glutamate deacylase